MARITLKELLQAEDIDAKVSELSFEVGMKLLEELVEKVESGSLALEQSVISYERGVLLVERLKSLLSGAEEKLRLLKEDAR